jgi:hypothetical protein
VSAKIDDGGAAFPMAGDTSNWDEKKRQYVPQHGMTLRDWFAGQALDLTSTLEHAHPTGSEGQPTYSGIATRAYYMADAMLAARKGGAND